jgi:hypothetical protein
MLLLAITWSVTGCDHSKKSAAFEVPSAVQSHVDEQCARMFPQRGLSRFLKFSIKGQEMIVEVRGLRQKPDVTPGVLSESERLNGVTERYSFVWGRASVGRGAAIMLDDKSGVQIFSGELPWTAWGDVGKEGELRDLLDEMCAPGLEVIRRNGEFSLQMHPRFDKLKGPLYLLDDPMHVWVPQPFADAELALLPAG